MILIGFTWIFVAIAAGLVVRYVIPGSWDHTGPLAFMVAGFGAFSGSVVASLLFTPPGRYEDPSTPAMVPGIVMSIVGGLLAFGLYAFDARRQQQA